MESISPTDCLILDIKWSQIFSMEILSIDVIISDRTCLPNLLSKFIVKLVFLVEMSLLSLQKNNSMGASSGVYCGKDIQHQSLSFKNSLTLDDQWTGELPIIMQILSLFTPIFFLIFSKEFEETQ